MEDPRKEKTSNMEPFIKLMRRYVIECADLHDEAVYDKYNEIMEPDYVVHMSGTNMNRDADFKPAVKLYFEQMPGLCLAMHDIITNGDRLAMIFTEHAGSLAHGGRLSAWTVVALYKWNRKRLTEVWVEQDFLSRFAQLETSKPHPIEPIHVDPWLIQSVPANPANEAIVRRWLLNGDFRDVAHAVIDDSWVTGSSEPVLSDVRTEINDLFSAGNRVPFHIKQTGKYRGGIAGVGNEYRGRDAVLYIAGVASVEGKSVNDVRAVTDRWGLQTRLLQKDVKTGDFAGGTEKSGVKTAS
jgi:predicted ester cyclase